jgi:type 1 fimbria pilin
MQHKLILAVAIAAATVSFSAQADTYTAQFSGTVLAQTGTTLAVDAPVSGQFVYDTETSRYTSFTIGSYAVAPGYESSAAMTPDQYSSIYQAQLSTLLPSPGLNSSFTLNLEGITKWPGVDALALLGNTASLASNLDASSSFGFYIANSDGTNVQSMTASLGSLTVAAVPEPGSWALMLSGLAVVGAGRLRRKA